jgi:hypothetical protein
VDASAGTNPGARAPRDAGAVPGPAAIPGELPAVLHAASPAAGLEAELDLFGRLVGSWDIEWLGHDRAGNAISVPGRLVMGWVLGGRAVQDVWQVPLPGRPAPPGMQPFHGTTLRFYDPVLCAWRSTWIEPYKGLVIRFIGRPTGDGVRLEAMDQDPPVRWSFRDVTPDSFRWTAEYTLDGGRTWIPEEEMRLRRR